MNFSLIHIASLIAIFQAVLMAVFSLQNKKTSRTSNIILASMLLIFAVINCGSLYMSIYPFKINIRYHKLIFMLGNLAFLIGPLLYFYIKSLLDMNFSLRKRDWIHTLPFMIAVICSLFIFQVYKHFNIWTFPSRIFFSSSILIQNLVYFIVALKNLQAYGLTLKSFLSYISNSRLAWVRFFVSGYIVLWSIQLQLFFGWDVLRQVAWCPYAMNLYSLTAFLFFNGMVYIGLMRPEMFHQGQKYQNSILKNSDKEEYQRKLISLMNQEKLYLNPSITLTEIAQKLDIAPCYVSQVINESFQQNFRDFVNKYRIEESKRLLTQQNQLLNIMGIALDAGFNSKSAFNSAFKKHTGITPKEFKKKTPQLA